MAVFTHISENQLAQHLSHFNIGTPVSFIGIIEGVENTNYKLATTGDQRGHRDFILTVFEKRTRPEDVPFYVAFMKHLHHHGIPCPDVVAGRNGEEITTLGGKPSIITSFLQGRSPQNIESFHLAALGKTLARMHHAGTSLKMRRDSTMSLPVWKFLIGSCAGKTDLFSLLQAELAYLEENWPQDLPAGAVHADLFPDNVFFTGKDLTGVIDFNFSCTDTFAYDLMLTLNAWCFEPAGLNRQKAAHMLDAYQAERSLTEAEQKSLGFFGRAAALRIVATRLYDQLHPAAGAVITPKNPLEYVEILKFYQREGFHL